MSWSWTRETLAVGEYTAEAVFGLVHPDWRQAGATPDEEREALPGDDLVPVPNWHATRAVTVGAPPAAVWPWLVQLGYGRGGWYGDFPWWKDPDSRMGGRGSAVAILPAFQRIAEGDVLLDGPDCDARTGAWTVRRVVDGQALVLFSRRAVGGRELLVDEDPPPVWLACSWAFAVRPAGDGTRARLITRTRVDLHPPSMMGPVRIVRAGDAVMQRGMLLGIKRRAEAGTAGADPVVIEDAP